MLIDCNKRIVEYINESQSYNNSFILWFLYNTFQRKDERKYKAHLLLRHFRNANKKLKESLGNSMLFTDIIYHISGTWCSISGEESSRKVQFSANKNTETLYPQENPLYKFFILDKVGIEFVMSHNIEDMTIEELIQMTRISYKMFDYINASEVEMPSGVQMSTYLFNIDNGKDSKTIYSYLHTIYNEICVGADNEAFRQKWEQYSKTFGLDPTIEYIFWRIGHWNFHEHDIRIKDDIVTKYAEAYVMKGKTATQEEIERIYKIFRRYVFTDDKFTFNPVVAGTLIVNGPRKFDYKIVENGQVVDK